MLHVSLYFQLIAVASSSHNRGHTFEESFGFKRAYDTYEEMADDDEVGKTGLTAAKRGLITVTCTILTSYLSFYLILMQDY